MDGNEDVVFTRHRRAEVSIFALSNKVSDLDTKIDAVPTTDEIKAAVDEGVAAAVSSLATLTKEELADSRLHFSETVAAAMKTISDAASANADDLKDAIATIKNKASKDDVDELKDDLRSLEHKCIRGYEFEVAPHTPTTNRKCQDFTVCKSTQFEKAAGTAEKDRVCVAKTECEKDKEYESDSGSATKDRTCKALTVCNKNQFEKKAPTATSDRECGTGLKNCKAYLDADENAKNGFYRIKYVTRARVHPCIFCSLQLCVCVLFFFFWGGVVISYCTT